MIVRRDTESACSCRDYYSKFILHLHPFEWVCLLTKLFLWGYTPSSRYAFSKSFTFKCPFRADSHDCAFCLNKRKDTGDDETVRIPSPSAF